MTTSARAMNGRLRRRECMFTRRVMWSHITLTYVRTSSSGRLQMIENIKCDMNMSNIYFVVVVFSPQRKPRNFDKHRARES